MAASKDLLVAKDICLGAGASVLSQSVGVAALFGGSGTGERYELTKTRHPWDRGTTERQSCASSQGRTVCLVRFVEMLDLHGLSFCASYSVCDSSGSFLENFPQFLFLKCSGKWGPDMG